MTFHEAALAFDDEDAVDEIEDSMDDGEERWQVTGRNGNRLLVVIYTMREGRARIISAREADSHERRQYDDQGR